MEPSLIETSLDWCDDETGAFGGEKCASLATSDENAVGIGGLGSGSGGLEESVLNSSIYTPTSLFSNEQTTDDDNLDTNDTNFSTDSLDRLHPLYEGNRYEYKLTMFDNLNEQQQHRGRGTTINTNTLLTEKDNKNNMNAVTATNNSSGSGSGSGNHNQNTRTSTAAATAAGYMLLNQNQNRTTSAPAPPPVTMRNHNANAIAMKAREIVCCYPSYALPDLSFLLQTSSAKVKLNPYSIQPSASSSDVSMASVSSVSSGKRYPTPVSGISMASAGATGSRSRASRPGFNTFSGGSGNGRPRPLSLNDLEAMKSKVVDWDSLSFLLPPEVRAMFGEPEGKKKRFSLQEPIEEHSILELTNDLEKNLGLYAGLVVESKLGEGDEYEALATSIHKTISSLKLPRAVRSPSSSSSPQISQLFTQLYTLLGSGLQPTLNTLFGPVPNTVWRVIEASVQNGGQLQELVLRVNAEECVDDGPVKVGCFLRGLVNLSLLPTYLSYLRTKERLLRTHYAHHAFMYLSGTSTRHLYDKLLGSLHEMQTRTRFELDIFEEAKEVLIRFRKTPGTKFSRNSNPGRKQHGRYSSGSGRPNTATATTPTDKYTHAYANPNAYAYAERMKRSQSEDEMRMRRPKTAAAGIGRIPKSQTQCNYNGLEKGMLEAEHNTFRKLRLQWEEKSSSRIPRLVSNSATATTASVKYK